MKSKLTLFKKWKILFILFGVLISADAYATHFRGGYINWKCINGGADIEIKVVSHWDQDGVPAVYTLSLGNGTSVYSRISNGELTETFSNTEYYTTEQIEVISASSITTGIVGFDNCCRTDPAGSYWSGSEYFSLYANINTGCNESPTIISPTFVNVDPGNNSSTFQLVANDAEGDAFSFAIANSSESGLTPSPTAFWPAGTLSSSGLITVNPSTLPGGPYSDGDLIPLPIKVTDVNGNYTQADLLIRLNSSVPNTDPDWDYSVTPADGSTIDFFAGVAGSINLRATDSDANSTVSFLPSGTPTGAMYTPALPNTSNPNESTLTWTPSASDAGSHAIQIIAEDNNGGQTVTNFTINVQACGSPVAICKDVTLGLDGNGQLTVTAADIDDGSTADCGLASMTVTGGSFSCVDTVGSHMVTLTVTDVNGASDQCTATVVVIDDTPPDPVCDQSEITVLSPQTGTVLISAEILNDGSFDNCTDAANLEYAFDEEFTILDSLMDCDNVGLFTYNIWVRDEAGNVSASCPAQLEVIDNTAPTCMTQNISVTLNHDGLASIVTADVDNGTWDHCGIDTVYLSRYDFTCEDVIYDGLTNTFSPVQIDLIAIDVNGNTATCPVEITVQDLGHIHVHCKDVTLSLDANHEVTLDPVQIIMPGSLYDNCGFHPTDSLSVSQSDFTCSDLGTNTITLTVKDKHGNEETCTAEVTIIDENNPIAVCKAFTLELGATGSATLAAEDIDDGSYDECGQPVTISAGQTAFDCSHLGTNTVTLTVTDASNNVSQCDATVTVVDNIDPVAVCQNITVELDAAGTASIVAADIDGGSTDNCGSVTLSIADGSFDCTNLGDNTVTLIADDGNGNTNTCDAIVTVVDYIAPTASCQDANIILDATGNAVVTLSDVYAGSSDNCAVTVEEHGPTSVSCDGIDMSGYTLLGDYNGKRYYQSNDDMSWADALDEAIAHGGMLASIDDAAENSFIASAISSNSWIGYSDRVEEDNFVWIDGNTSSYTNWNAGEPNDLGGEDNTEIFAGSGLWNDLPDASTRTYVMETLIPGVNQVSATVYVEDQSGNSSACMSLITIIDDTDPNAICMDATVYLDANGEATITTADINNGSSDACGIASMSLDMTAFDCSHVGLINTVTLSVVDNSGNVGTCTATVTVVDDTNPTCIAQDITVSLDEFSPPGGNVTVNASDINNGSYDNCGIDTYEIRRASGGSFASSLSLDCSDVAASPIQVELRVTDVNGNPSICSATITVLDETSPFMNCQDEINVPLNSDGNGAVIGMNLLGWFGIYDACGIDQILVDGQPVRYFTCADLTNDDLMVTVSAYDNNGNVTECMVDITVEDKENPECVSQDITVQLDANGMVSIVASDIDNGSTDNCTIVSWTLDRYDFTCADVGDQTVTLTVEDQSGNTSTCTAIVTVEDNVAPTMVCQNITVQLDASGNASITTADIDNGSSDACGIASMSLDKSSFDCSEVGTNTVTLTAIDNNGNSNTCMATVTVEDNVAPTAICQDYTLQLDAGGSGSITTANIDNGSNDACGIASLALDITSFSCSDVGANTVTLTVTDNNNNTSTCTATVTVVDNVVPDADCADLTVQLDANGVATVQPSDLDAGSYDACGIANICIGKGVETSSLAGTLELSDPTFFFEDDAAVNPCYFDSNIFNGCCELIEGNHHYDQQQFSITAADTYTFTLNDINDATDFTGVIYDSEFNPLDLCANIIYGDDDSAGSLDPQIVITLALVPGDYILVTSTYRAGDDDFPAPYTWDVTSAAGGMISAFECASSIEYGCDDVGANTATICVTDNNGNVSYCSATVTVEDNVAPTALCQDVTVQLDATGNGSVTAANVDNGSNDACGIASLALLETDTSYDCTDIGSSIVVTLIVTDENNNSSSCTANVTVEDNVDPVAECQDVTVELDATGNGVLVPADLDGGSTDACGIDLNGYSASKTSFNCSDVGMEMVELTVTDNNGNTATCEATVTIVDITPPVAQCQDVTLYLDFSGSATLDAAQLDNGSNDACGLAPNPFSADITSFGCAQVGANPVVLTVTDVNGNTSTCSSTVTIIDDVKPMVNCVNNVEVPLNGDGNGFVTKEEVLSAAFDACGIIDTVIIGDGQIGDTLYFDCADIGLVPVTIRVTDANGNVEECNTEVNVKDEIAPVMSCISMPTTIYLDANGEAVLDPVDLDAGTTDNCGPITFTASQTDYVCTDLGIHNVTLYATDGQGNQNSCNAMVVVADNIDPVAVCQDITVQLDANGNASITAADINNGSSDNCGIVSMTIDDEDFDCSNVGANPVTLTVEDQAGNTKSCIATVTVEDNVAPTAICHDITVELLDDGTVSITASDIDNGSNDACGIASLALDKTSFVCGDVGNNTVTLTVTDNNGQVSQCTATVTVEDNVAPVVACKDITVQLDASGAATIAHDAIDDGSADECTAVTFSTDVTSFACANVGPNTVVMTVTDAYGNAANCSATVTVEDNIAPVANCKAVTIQLDASGAATLDPAMLNDGSTDACGIDMTAFVASKTAFDCTNVGVNTVTLTVYDNNGNSAQCDAEVTVEDNVAPTALCADYTVQLDASGAATITAANVDGGSSDACGIASMSVSPSAFDCSHVGTTNTVTLTVTDNNGNVSTCEATVTVEDNVAPTATCQAYTLELDATGNATLLPENVDDASSDACGIASMTVSPNTFDCSHIGANTVTLTVEDVNGNVNTCTTTVTVVDVTGPAITCPANIEKFTLPSDCNQNVIMPPLAPVDECTGLATYEYQAVGITFINTGVDVFALFPVGLTEVTAIATDGFGNTSTCSFFVEVIDNIDPVVTGCADIGDMTVPSDAGTCGAVVTWDESLINANDNCSGLGDGLDLSSNYSSGDEFPVGTTTVVYTAIDEEGNSAECSFDVTVLPAEGVASYTYIDASLEVQFTDASDNAASWAWDFGDGNTSTEPSPNYTYATEGTYNVCLTITDVCGDTDTYCEDITLVNSGNMGIDQMVLMPGWNLISLDVDPMDSTIPSVFDGHLNGDIGLISGFENAALFYDPALPPMLNSLVEVKPGYGYWVFANNEFTLSVSGAEIDPNYKRDLDQGWNLISYSPDVPMAPNMYFNDLETMGALEYVSGYNPDDGIMTYDPSLPAIPGLQSLGTLENGYGYWVKTNQTVNGPWIDGDDQTEVRDDHTDDWGNKITSSYDFILGKVQGVSIGEMIDIIDEDRKVVAQLEVIQDNYLMTLPIYGDDASTEELDGLVSGQELSFSYNGAVSDLTVLFDGNRNVNFVELDFRSVNVETPELEDETVTMYPNPFVHEATITINTKSAAHFNMIVMDVAGAVVLDKDLGKLAQGTNEIILEKGDLPTGQYHVLVHNKDTNNVTRLKAMIVQ